MSCMSAAVVDVVDVVAVRDRHVATAIAMNMVVLRMRFMRAGGLAFVVVIIVPSMKVTVVQIVDVITMRDGNMSAAFAVDVRVIDVFVVNCLGHRFHRRLNPVAPAIRCSSTPTLRYERPLAGKRLATPRCRGSEVRATKSETTGLTPRWLARPRNQRRRLPNCWRHARSARCLTRSVARGLHPTAVPRPHDLSSSIRVLPGYASGRVRSMAATCKFG